MTDNTTGTFDKHAGYTRKLCFSFRLAKDADVIKALDDAPNMVGLVRQAIRAWVACDRYGEEE